MGRLFILCLIWIAFFGDMSKADTKMTNEHLTNSLRVLQGMYDNVTATVLQLQSYINTLQKDLDDQEKVIEKKCSSPSPCYSSTGIVCTGNKYQCDTTNNFARGSAGDTTCDCASGYALQKVACKKVIDQLCTSTSECYSSVGIVCTGGKCQCDTRNHFAKGTSGATSCACNATGYFLQNGVCKKVIEETCNSVSECSSSTGIVCTGGKCQCDTTKNFATGRAGDTSCDCPPGLSLQNGSCTCNATGYFLQNGVCKKVIEETCNSASECSSSTGIVCTGGKCQCDTTKHFATGRAGDTSCDCAPGLSLKIGTCTCNATGYFLQNGVCKKVIEETCLSASECSSSTGIVCTGGKCHCDTAKHFATGRAGDTSCDCVSGFSLQNGVCSCSASGYFLQNGVCKKVIEETCSSASECSSSTGIVCTGGKCQCDTTKHFAAGRAGDTTCDCESGYSLRRGKCSCSERGYFLQNGDCKKVIEETCSSASECSSNTGIVCSGGKCQCDTTKHFAAGRAGDTSCGCKSGFTMSEGSCKGKLGQSCTSTSECYTNTGVVCSGGVCQCDSTKHFAAGLAFGTTCHCTSEYSLQDGACFREPTSCGDVKKDNGESGVYTLHVRDKYIKVYCEQTIDNGGWIVIQRRQDGSVDFYRNWEQYEAGFGNLTGEFWIGLANLHHLTKFQDVKLRVDMMDFDGSTAYAIYNSFNISGPEDNYRLNVGGYSGNAGDSLGRHNRMQFSTYDKDNDPDNNLNIAKNYRGGWWYNFSVFSHLNSRYPKSNILNAGGMVWYHWKNDWRQLKRVEMKIKPRNLN